MVRFPLKQKMRKGKGAIGLYGPEQPTMSRVKGPDVIEEEPVIEEECKTRQRQWKKSTVTVHGAYYCGFLKHYLHRAMSPIVFYDVVSNCKC
ncbi:hypothetical protein CEXT_438721 [Caerostris extrusa]|uniref:Uncharacterized protein n=1 Tax=Caerostris extrusa TaxID=172846 RepID=A0AAV4XQF6_CAEEX|nr:hypothetical protein CEXT_438721 [Caerostris extrusa]